MTFATKRMMRAEDLDLRTKIELLADLCGELALNQHLYEGPDPIVWTCLGVTPNFNAETVAEVFAAEGPTLDAAVSDAIRQAKVKGLLGSSDFDDETQR